MEIPIDPELLAQGMSLANTVAGASDEELPDAVEDAIFDRIVDPDAHSQHCKFSLGPLEYVTFLSTTNVIRNQFIAARKASERPELLQPFAGNSRDAPTLFMAQCKNHVFGCSFTTANMNTLTAHETICQLTSFDTLKPAKSFTCPKCSKLYVSEVEMNAHLKRVHEPWVPKACGQPRVTCDTTVLYSTQNEYDRHMKQYHSGKTLLFNPGRCTVPGCSVNTVYQKYDGLRSHLMSFHKFNANDSRPYLPRFPKRPKFVEQKCPVQGCKSEVTIRSVSQLKAHLQLRGHDLTMDEIDAYLIAVRRE